MTLIENYADWVKVQPRDTIRQNLQITRRNLDEIKVSPDLSEHDREVIGAVWRQRAEVEEAALDSVRQTPPAQITVTVYAGTNQIATGLHKGQNLDGVVAEFERAAGFSGPVDLKIGAAYRGSWREFWRQLQDVTISEV